MRSVYALWGLILIHHSRDLKYSVLDLVWHSCKDFAAIHIDSLYIECNFFIIILDNSSSRKRWSLGNYEKQKLKKGTIIWRNMLFRMLGKFKMHEVEIVILTITNPNPFLIWGDKTFLIFTPILWLVGVTLILLYIFCLNYYF